MWCVSRGPSHSIELFSVCDSARCVERNCYELRIMGLWELLYAYDLGVLIEIYKIS